jgi:hypothetical protein
VTTCRRFGHPRETYGQGTSCRQCERDRSQWITALGLMARLLRQRGHRVAHRPRQTRLTLIQET